MTITQSRAEFIDTYTTKVLSGEELSQEQAEIFLEEDISLENILIGAQKIREAYHGNAATLCGIVNAKSGLCSQDCSFCAQSSYHTSNTQRYSLLSCESLYEKAQAVYRMKASHFGIVTSGSSVSEPELSGICKAIRKITKDFSLSVDASLGTMSETQLDRLYSAGLRRYHHNLETSERFFPSICTTHDFQDRVNTIKNAKKIGLEVCSGGLFGLGETWQDRIDLAFLLRDLQVDAVPINFLNPVPGTALENMKKLTPSEALKIIALYRFILPQKEIKVCGGRETVLHDLQSWIFRAGATGMMIGNYLTTQGRSPEDDLQMIEDLGLSIKGC